jgi:hypothetical protein
MANYPNIDLTGKVVVIKTEVHTGTTDDITTRLFRCDKGNGLDPQGMGRQIFGVFICNPAKGDGLFAINGQTDIERLAAQKEIELAH